jgi:hypothetical protein
VQTVNGGGYTIDDQEQLKEKIDRLENETNRLENEINRLKTERQQPDQETPDRSPDTPTDSQAGVSRRGFLKAVAGGAAGLGLTGMLPSAAALDIKSPHDLSYYGGGSTTPDLEVDTQGNLNLGGSNITNAGSINTGELSVTDSLDSPSIVTVPVSDGESGIQSALDNVSTYTRIHLGRGTYTISSELTGNADAILIEGQGKGATRVKAADGSEAQPLAFGTGGNTHRYLCVRDLTVDGNRANQSDTTVNKHGLEISNYDHVDVKNVEIKNTHPGDSELGGNGPGADGLRINESVTSYHVENVNTANIGYDALKVMGDRGHIEGCEAVGADNRGISLNDRDSSGDDADYVTISNCIAEGGAWATSGASAIGGRRDAKWISVIGCHVFGAAGGGRRGIMLGGSGQATVVGCAVDGTNLTDHGIFLRAGGVAAGHNVVAKVDGDGVRTLGTTSLIGPHAILKPSGDGISAGAATTVAIYGGAIKEAKSNGINAAAERVTITGGAINGANQHGVKVTSDNFNITGTGVYVPSYGNTDTYDGFNIDANKGSLSGFTVAVGSDGRDGVRVTGTNDDVTVTPGYVEPSSVNSSRYNVPNNCVVGFEAVESANAETPQGTYPPGTFVRFTDSGDGSGTGTYLIARDGTSVQVSSDT